MGQSVSRNKNCLLCSSSKVPTDDIINEITQRREYYRNDYQLHFQVIQKTNLTIKTSDIQRCSCFVICYDERDRSTFEEASSLANQIQDIHGPVPMVFYVRGTGDDTVTEGEGRHLAHQYSAFYYHSTSRNVSLHRALKVQFNGIRFTTDHSQLKSRTQFIKRAR